jgi:hypothetical protein
MAMRHDFVVDRTYSVKAFCPVIVIAEQMREGHCDTDFSGEV